MVREWRLLRLPIIAAAHAEPRNLADSQCGRWRCLGCCLPRPEANLAAGALPAAFRSSSFVFFPPSLTLERSVDGPQAHV